ncbi:GAF domain-containing protein [Cellulomonas sp. JZ18]|uniref:GAF domain-containing protein n=1 Tax=Cellulomonas sp. JZ18 TaxID=2654191 RepID=UPI0018AF7D64|nr:GAF domain-containing protein [Cellulomonas sp. JZ18]
MPTTPAVPDPAVDLDERRRLEALAAYAVVEAFDEPEFNDLVALVGDLLKAPVATIGVLDESQEWFKARLGTDVRRIPREESFARHLLAEPDAPLAVEDMTADPRFATSAFVTGHPHFRSYLAVPVVSVDGTFLGTLEALDVVPRTWTEREIRHLRTLAQVLEAHLELRKFIRALAAA